MPGPPAQPTKLRVMRGNPGRRPLNDREPEPAASDQQPPSWLSEQARPFWEEFAPVVADMSVLTKADEAALALLCEAMADYLAARDSGVNSKINDAFSRALRLMDRFGLNPAYRSKLKADPKAPNNPLEKFTKGGKR